MDRRGPGHDHVEIRAFSCLPITTDPPNYAARASVSSHRLRGNFLRWAGHSLKSSRNVGMTLDLNLESTACGRAQAAIGGDHRRALSRPPTGTRSGGTFVTPGSG
jgi:hypothetical protein